MRTLQLRVICHILCKRARTCWSAGVATPVVNTVGSVGRMTGANAVARWYLTPNGTMEAERENEHQGRSKRRRVEGMDVEAGIISPRNTVRRDSGGSLPSYHSSRPPSYRDEASPATVDRSRPAHGRTWSQQLMLSASGLGVAMSETSRNALVYSLTLLGSGSQHINTVAGALKLVLEQYDEARDQFHQRCDSSMEKGERPRTPDADDSARRLAGIIQQHCDDIWLTLKTVLDTVAHAVSGALPSNVQHYVIGQLRSVLPRWHHVTITQRRESETSRNAHRMVAFAMEGLDIIAHVSHACKNTLDSAEGWAQTMTLPGGRGRPAEERLSEYPRYRDEDDYQMADATDGRQRQREQQQ